MRFSRRRFIKSSLFLPAVASVPLSPENVPLQRNSSFDPWVEIRADHLKHNVAEISRRAGERPILAVIKNNGYGLGVVNVATILEPLGAIAGFAVVKLQEAFTLRENGVTKPIVLLGPLAETEIEEAVARAIEPIVYTPIGTVLERVSTKLRKKVPIHICIDTGIGRVGVPYREAKRLVKDLASRTSIHIKSTMMTFTEDKDFDNVQFERFRFLCDELKKDGVEIGIRHAVSSFGLFQHPDKFLDMVRPGMAIYGIYSENEFRSLKVMDLRPAVALNCRVAYVKKLEKGESAGYERAFVAQEDTWVATLPVGHADGVPRVVTKGARVRIGGELFPAIAISASHCIVNLGKEPKVTIGDVATIFDWNNASRPEDVAAACGSSVYDLTMHLNPLLPRTVV